MKMKAKGITLLAIAVAIVIIGSYSLGYSVGVVTTSEKIITVEVEKQQPMLLVEFLDWGESEDNSQEVIFSYWINNFGNVEAKNVSITCKIQDSNKNVIKQQTYNKGNVASNSYEYQDVTMEYIISDYDNVFGTCVLETADGDYINLYDRLEEFK